MIAIRGCFFKSARFFGAACLLFILTHTVSAATLYIDPAQSELPRGDSRSYAVRIDVDEDECINAVDATISYSEVIRAVDVSRGDSILSLWLEDPVIDEANKTITFAGGIPNGYCGRIQGDPRLTNVIAEIIFRAPSFSIGRGDNNDARIVFEDQTRVFLNDGAGTEASLVTKNAQIALTDSLSSSVNDEWTEEVNADTRPPEAFSIELVQQEGVFGGKYFIVFNTTDKQSGIDHYEVMEEPLEESGLFRWGAVDAPWTETRSPYVLKDQNLRSTIRVRAIDKAGNERIATLVADESLRRNFIILDVVLVLVIVLLLGAIGFVIWRTLKKRKGISKSSDIEDVQIETPTGVEKQGDSNVEAKKVTSARKPRKKTTKKTTKKSTKTTTSTKKQTPKDQ